MMKQKILGTILMTACAYYYCTSEGTNQLDRQVLTQGPTQNNSKQFMLFDDSGKGNMTKIYDSSINQIKFIIPINSSTIQIIPK